MSLCPYKLWVRLGESRKQVSEMKIPASANSRETTGFRWQDLLSEKSRQPHGGHGVGSSWLLLLQLRRPKLREAKELASSCRGGTRTEA